MRPNICMHLTGYSGLRPQEMRSVSPPIFIKETGDATKRVLPGAGGDIQIRRNHCQWQRYQRIRQRRNNESPMTGWVWCISRNALLPIGLKLVQDKAHHCCITPVHNMPIDKYKGLLEEMALHAKRVFKRKVRQYEKNWNSAWLSQRPRYYWRLSWKERPRWLGYANHPTMRTRLRIPGTISSSLGFC